MADEPVVNLSDYRSLKRREIERTILVVDDDEIMRSAMKRILEASGCRVIISADGLELSQILERQKFDLILLDVNLPWVNGFELCGLLKSNPDFSKIPLILVSARKTKEDIEAGFAAGCDNYITKPFDVEHLSQVVDETLQNIT